LGGPDRPSARRNTNLTFDVDDYEGTATMKVTTHFHGHAADSMRRYLVGKNYETISEDYLNFYAEDYPGIREPTPLEITDDREQNILLIKEQYLVDNLFVRDKEDEPLYIALYPYGMTRSLPSLTTKTILKKSRILPSSSQHTSVSTGPLQSLSIRLRRCRIGCPQMRSRNT